MWRSIFLALGVMAVIVGFECMIIDSANVYAAGETNASAFINPLGDPSPSTREWRPKEWYPWAILSTGAVVIIYAFTLPSRWGRGASE